MGAGSDAPEKKEVKIGFIPLTDCASVVIASVMEFDKKYGIKIVPTKEASWAAVRDKLVNGELDARTCSTASIYGVQMGIGGPKKDMAVLMNLNHNGQAITLSQPAEGQGRGRRREAQALIDRRSASTRSRRRSRPARTRCGSTTGSRPTASTRCNDVKTITVPPPQMVANMRVGNMDGFCVGEPWNNRAIYDKIGFTAETTQGIWKDHPEKTLGTTAEFVQKNPNTARAMTAAMLEAASSSTSMAEPQEGRRDHRRQVVRQLPGRRHRPARSRATTTTGSAAAGRIPTT